MTELKVHATPCDSEPMVHQEEMRSAFVTRLKKAAADAGIPAWGLGARLSTITGKTAKAASKWLNGEAMPGRPAMQAIADALHVRVEWLQFGKGFPTIDLEDSMSPMIHGFRKGNASTEHANVKPAPQPHREAREYPVISWVAAGSWTEACEIHQPGVAEEWLASNENAGACGYWLEVSGDSMSPPTGFSFSSGMFILVQPEGFDLVSGKYYVAKMLDTGETTFKQYVRDAGIEYLRPLNPAYRTMEITDNVRIIGRVIDAKLPRSVL